MGTPSRGRAATLDWDSATWVNGVLNQSVDAGGVTINFAFTGDTSRLLSSGGVSTPANQNNILTGGTSPAEKSLLLALDTAANTEAVTVTVSFYQLGTTTLQAVSGLNFKIFDIDESSTYDDQIRGLSANLNGGSSFSPITVTGSPDNVVSGDAAAGFVVTGIAGATNTGAGSDQGNATIDFGLTRALSSFTYTYGNSTTAPANPTTQYSSLYDLNFTVVPEPSASGLIALAATILIVLRRVPARPEMR